MGHGVKDEAEDTQVYFVTTGYLVRLIAHQPAAFYSHTHLIIDEVHERSVDGDLLCLLARRLLQVVDVDVDDNGTFNLGLDVLVYYLSLMLLLVYILMIYLAYIIFEYTYISHHLPVKKLHTDTTMYRYN